MPEPAVTKLQLTVNRPPDPQTASGSSRTVPYAQSESYPRMERRRELRSPQMAARRLVLALALLACPRTAQGAASCAACAAGTICIVETAATTTLSAGQTTLDLKVCNWDKTKSAASAIEFSLKQALSCDPSGTLLPKAKTVTADASCAADACVVHVALESPLDAAVAAKTGESANVLLAKLKTGTEAAVPIASSAAESGGVISSLQDAKHGIAVCSASIPVNGLRFSQAPACNTVGICQAKAGATGCATTVDTATLSDVQCTGEKCTADIVLAKPFACAAAAAAENNVLVNVRVGNAPGLTFSNLGTISAAPTISRVDQLVSGSKELVLHTSAACAASELLLSISELQVSKLATPTNGSLTVTLAKSIDSSLSNKELTVSISQCGVAGSPFAAVVDRANEEAGSTDSNATTTSDFVPTSNLASGDGSLVSTQHKNMKTGMSGGAYLAILAGVLALFGFLFECLRTRKAFHRALANAQADDSMNLAAS